MSDQAKPIRATSLKTMKVGQLMNRRVTTVRASDDMAHAASVLEEFDVGGVPVVDEAGRCVGVLSAADFVDRECEHTAEGETGTPERHVLVQSAETGLTIEARCDDRVSSHMNPVVQTVDAEQSLYEAGLVMCGEHIHRLVVLDGAARPIGVVSALDLVAAALAVSDEVSG